MKANLIPLSDHCGELMASGCTLFQVIFIQKHLDRALKLKPQTNQSSELILSKCNVSVIRGAKCLNTWFSFSLAT